MAVSLDQVNTLATAIFRLRERSERYELRYLTKKGEIKMKSMNLFSDAGVKSSEALFGDSKPKETMKPKKREHSKEFKELAVNLTSKIGVAGCENLYHIDVSYKWILNEDAENNEVFNDCYRLPHYRDSRLGTEMFCSVNEGGYFHYVGEEDDYE